MLLTWNNLPHHHSLSPKRSSSPTCSRRWASRASAGSQCWEKKPCFEQISFFFLVFHLKIRHQQRMGESCRNFSLSGNSGAY